MDYLERVYPFGKFKDQKLKDIDTAYLVYAIENFDLSEDLKYDIEWTLLYKIKAFTSFSNYLQLIFDIEDCKFSRKQQEYLLAFIDRDIYEEREISKFK